MTGVKAADLGEGNVAGEAGGRASRVYALIVTFRRPEGLRRIVSQLLQQTTLPEVLVIVDNDPLAANKATAEEAGRAGWDVRYVAAPENLGPAGGTALAMRQLAEEAGGNDWLLRFDDDEGSVYPELVGELVEFGEAIRRIDPQVGGVGAMGARYNWRVGRLERLRDEEITAITSVDYLPTNRYAMFSFDAVHKAGTFDADLFYGFSEVEYGLRLRSHGFALYASGAIWRRFGRTTQQTAGAKLSLRQSGWRRYYTLRNQIWLHTRAGQRTTALRIAVLRGLLKPALNLAPHPREATTHLALNWRAVKDGLRGNLGRTVEPG
jgi:GT2 family glycosyltransferase